MTKIIDNFDLIEEYINLVCPDFNKNEDLYFAVEIIRRGKDNPDMPAANYRLKTFCIHSISELRKRKHEIVKICDAINARAYFSINEKSMLQVAMNTVTEMARRIAVHDIKKIQDVFAHQSGLYLNIKNKRWIVDVDSIEGLPLNLVTDKFKEAIRVSNTHKSDEDVILFTVPTMDGCHIITRPFNSEQFKLNIAKVGLDPDKIDLKEVIKKNHLTLLYYRKDGGDNSIG